jgi:tRNA (guanine-N7-)-methyltransferase
METELAIDPRRYALAPRLPEGGEVDVRGLLHGRTARLEVEVGPGRGGFLLDRLLSRADVGLVAFEVKRKWAVIVNERLARHGVADRGRVFADDARLALPRLGPDGSIDALFVHFPDPWWKKRHTKRLVLGTDVLDQAARLLRPGGELFIQTDVEERAALYEAHVGAHPAFAPHGDTAGAARLAENPYGARSHRERRAIEDQIPIYRLRFTRRPR